MKLIIQIPCYNEAETLPVTLADLPTEIRGIDSIETQVIDDGSSDNTFEVAKRLGVNHVIKFKRNKGLAAAFKAGVDNALLNEADILVNTDGDHQYSGKDIPKLVEPILNGSSNIVVGCRPIDDHPEFTFIKKKLQKIGSWVLRKVSKTNVRDAASGFRAYDKDAMLRINIFSSFSYCMETLIQAGYYNLEIGTCDINVNPKIRESRLFRNIFQYIFKSGATIVNMFLLYRSSAFFSGLAGLTFLISIFLVLRYLYLVFMMGAPKDVFWPTIILSGILLVISCFLYLTGIITSLIAANRKLNEEVLYLLKKNNNQSFPANPQESNKEECAE